MPSPSGSISKPNKQQRHRTASAAVKACKECQKRKGRCTGGVPCEYCVKSNKPCLYEERPARLPLTRKNVELLENKVAKLEKILTTLHPDLNISTLMQQDDVNDTSVNTSKNGSPTSRIHNLDDDNDDSSSDDEELMEWHEDTSGRDALENVQDGTGNFDGNVNETGYIGKSAGSSVLRIIYKLLDINRNCIAPPMTNSSDDNSSNNENDDDFNVSNINTAERQIMTVTIRDSLVDSFFWTYNSFYPILHEYTFRQQYNRLDEIPDNSHFHLLLRMVMAFGSLCATKQANNNDYCFFLSARSRISADMLESGTIDQIQILLLMANYLQKRDKPNSGYIYLGLAVRMAIGMGLHKEVHSAYQNKKSTVKMEIRRRLLWVLYLFDSGASITFGRPPIMADRVVDVKVPLNIDDTKMSPSELVPDSVTHATPYTATIAFAKLSIISGRIFERFFMKHRVIETPAQLAEYMHLIEGFDRQLAQWRSELVDDFYNDDCPDWFIGPRAVCLWREMNLRTLMYKGLLESVSQGKLTDKLPQGYLQRCLNASISTVKSIREYCDKYSDQLWWGVTWYETYYLFQADLFIILAILISYRYQTKVNLNECHEALGVSIELFKKLENSNPGGARRSMAVLTHIDAVIRQQNSQTNTPGGGSSSNATTSQSNLPMQQPTPTPPQQQQESPMSQDFNNDGEQAAGLLITAGVAATSNFPMNLLPVNYNNSGIDTSYTGMTNLADHFKPHQSTSSAGTTPSPYTALDNGSHSHSSSMPGLYSFDMSFLDNLVNVSEDSSLNYTIKNEPHGIEF